MSPVSQQTPRSDVPSRASLQSYPAAILLSHRALVRLSDLTARTKPNAEAGAYSIRHRHQWRWPPTHWRRDLFASLAEAHAARRLAEEMMLISAELGRSGG